MTDILPSPPHLHPSPPTSINARLRHQPFLNHESFISTAPVALCRGEFSTAQEEEEEEEDQDHLSVLAALVTVFRKSLVGCSDTNRGVEEQLMEIGWPTDVRHVAHVTFDRFDGFLGLPVEFEPEIPRRPPSASTTVFGVSTESMQLSFDLRGNCVPTILLMMQRRLYSQGGLQSEGIFRINPGNGQEEYVREQLNNGHIPENIDVHCLASLIKAWFRELPRGVLDSLPRDQVMEAQSEDECARLVRLLPPTEAALLDWAINLMADVVQFESSNKMNARNIAMVFAPNMTQMSDPLTALMYAVQVMNFLKALIVKTLREREDRPIEAGPALHSEPTDEDGQQGIPKPVHPLYTETSEEEEQGQNWMTTPASQVELRTQTSSYETTNPTESNEKAENHDVTNAPAATSSKGLKCTSSTTLVRSSKGTSRRSQTRHPGGANDAKRGLRKHVPVHEKKDLNIVSRVNVRVEERVEAWR